ncbi:MAG: PAS domain-containing protein [Gammaproteobacteria bacterium]|nr:PAS domain-containing protein [Gammaproteobacteria bacterium]MBQ0839179.1 PAS domain-containing protein [Gammaproteobacteria bacterium]
MTEPSLNLVDEELNFNIDEVIVSKTDLTGKITYANDVFCRMAEMTTDEIIGKPHNIIRHPDMPRVIFKVLWDTLQQEEEIFAYVKNRSKTGRYYWVLAHVTPSYDQNHQLNGYHSNRRCPDRTSLEEIAELYQSLLKEEGKHQNPELGMKASASLLASILDEEGQSYPEFVWSTMRAL